MVVDCARKAETLDMMHLGDQAPSKARAQRFSGRPERRFGLAWLHLLALAAWAIAQPLFSALRQHPTWLVAHRIEPFSLLVLIAAALFTIPLVVGALALLMARLAGSIWGQRLLQASLGCLVTLALLPLVDRAPGSDLLLLILALAAGLWTAFAWHRHRTLRYLLTAILPGVALFPLHFVARAPVWALWQPAAAERVVASPRPGPTNSITPPTPTPTPTVVFVLLDELPLLSLLDLDLHIDRHRFPEFARWAATSTWYRNATTVADATAQAVPALLTGRRPKGRSAPTHVNHPDNLFTFLARAGLPLNIVETDTALCPPALCAGRSEPLGTALETASPATATTVDLLADAAAVYLAIVTPTALHRRLRLPPVDRGWRDFWHRSAGRSLAASASTPDDDRLPVPQAMAQLLAGLGDQPAGLHFAHLLLPHAPWDHLPSGRRYDGDDIPGLINHLWVGDPWLVTQAYQRHLLQLGYLDALLGELRHRLETLGLFDRALVVLAADHGVAFIPHQPWRRINRFNAAEIANVPLLIKRPGQRRGVIDDRAVETIDLLPTVLAQVARASRQPNPAAGTFDGHDLDAPSWSAHRAATPRDCFVSRLRVSSTPLALPATWPDQRRARLTWKVANLGQGPRSLLRIGPHAELVGRLVADFEIAASATEVQITFDQPPAAPALPRARLTGVVGVVGGTAADPGAVESIPLVLAIGGRIRASTRTYPDRGTVRFSAMIDPSGTDPPSTAAAPPTAFVVISRETGYALVPARSATGKRP